MEDFYHFVNNKKSL